MKTWNGLVQRAKDTLEAFYEDTRWMRGDGRYNHHQLSNEIIFIPESLSNYEDAFSPKIKFHTFLVGLSTANYSSFEKN